MSELLRGEALVEKLHADHLNSIRFMNVIADRLEPLYDQWQADHSWSEVEVGKYLKIPALWRAFDGVYNDPDYAHLQQATVDTCQYGALYGDNEELFDTAVSLGLETALLAGSRSELYIKPKESYGLEPHEVYSSESVFLVP